MTIQNDYALRDWRLCVTKSYLEYASTFEMSLRVPSSETVAAGVAGNTAFTQQTSGQRTCPDLSYGLCGSGSESQVPSQYAFGYPRGCISYIGSQYSPNPGGQIYYYNEYGPPDGSAVTYQDCGYTDYVGYVYTCECDASAAGRRLSAAPPPSPAMPCHFEETCTDRGTADAALEYCTQTSTAALCELSRYPSRESMASSETVVSRRRLSARRQLQGGTQTSGQRDESACPVGILADCPNANQVPSTYASSYPIGCSVIDTGGGNTIYFWMETGSGPFADCGVLSSGSMFTCVCLTPAAPPPPPQAPCTTLADLPFSDLPSQAPAGTYTADSAGAAAYCAAQTNLQRCEEATTITQSTTTALVAGARPGTCNVPDATACTSAAQLYTGDASTTIEAMEMGPNIPAGCVYDGTSTSFYFNTFASTSDCGGGSGSWACMCYAAPTALTFSGTRPATCNIPDATTCTAVAQLHSGNAATTSQALEMGPNIPAGCVAAGGVYYFNTFASTTDCGGGSGSWACLCYAASVTVSTVVQQCATIVDRQNDATANVRVVTSTFTLTTLTIETFDAAAQLTFRTAVKTYLSLDSVDLVTLTSIVGGSVVVNVQVEVTAATEATVTTALSDTTTNLQTGIDSRISLVTVPTSSTVELAGQFTCECLVDAPLTILAAGSLANGAHLDEMCFADGAQAQPTTAASFKGRVTGTWAPATGGAHTLRDYFQRNIVSEGAAGGQTLLTVHSSVYSPLALDALTIRLCASTVSPPSLPDASPTPPSPPDAPAAPPLPPIAPQSCRSAPMGGTSTAILDSSAPTDRLNDAFTVCLTSSGGIAQGNLLRVSLLTPGDGRTLELFDAGRLKKGTTLSGVCFSDIAPRLRGAPRLEGTATGTYKPTDDRAEATTLNDLVFAAATRVSTGFTVQIQLVIEGVSAADAGISATLEACSSAHPSPALPPSAPPPVAPPPPQHPPLPPLSCMGEFKTIATDFSFGGTPGAYESTPPILLSLDHSVHPQHSLELSFTGTIKAAHCTRAEIGLGLNVEIFNEGAFSSPVVTMASTVFAGPGTPTHRPITGSDLSGQRHAALNFGPLVSRLEGMRTALVGFTSVNTGDCAGVIQPGDVSTLTIGLRVCDIPPAPAPPPLAPPPDSPAGHYPLDLTLGFIGNVIVDEASPAQDPAFHATIYHGLAFNMRHTCVAECVDMVAGRVVGWARQSSGNCAVLDSVGVLANSGADLVATYSPISRDAGDTAFNFCLSSALGYDRIRHYQITINSLDRPPSTPPPEPSAPPTPPPAFLCSDWNHEARTGVVACPVAVGATTEERRAQCEQYYVTNIGSEHEVKPCYLNIDTDGAEDCRPWVGAYEVCPPSAPPPVAPPAPPAALLPSCQKVGDSVVNHGPGDAGREAANARCHLLRTANTQLGYGGCVVTEIAPINAFLEQTSGTRSCAGLGARDPTSAECEARASSLGLYWGAQLLPRNNLFHFSPLCHALC
jgi:hypothetical protein